MAHEGMVHALKECWRVLVPKGQLLDMRPLGGARSVQVVADGEAFTTGEVDDSAGFPDDEAADRAMAAVVQDRYFLRDGGNHFRFAYYWDALEELQGYVEERWDFARLPESTRAATVHQIEALKGSPFRIRVYATVQVVSYRKVDPARTIL